MIRTAPQITNLTWEDKNRTDKFNEEKINTLTRFFKTEKGVKLLSFIKEEDAIKFNNILEEIDQIRQENWDMRKRIHRLSEDYSQYFKNTYFPEVSDLVVRVQKESLSFNLVKGKHRKELFSIQMNRDWQDEKKIEKIELSYYTSRCEDDDIFELDRIILLGKMAQYLKEKDFQKDLAKFTNRIIDFEQEHRQYDSALVTEKNKLLEKMMLIQIKTLEKVDFLRPIKLHNGDKISSLKILKRNEKTTEIEYETLYEGKNNLRMKNDQFISIMKSYLNGNINIVPKKST